MYSNHSRRGCAQSCIQGWPARIKNGKGWDYRQMVRTPLVLLVAIFASLAYGAPHAKPDASTFFRDQIGLTSQQIAAIDQGKVVAKVLPSSSAEEIFIFGAVFVKAKPKDYVSFAFDADRLRKVPGYMAIGRVSNPPRMSDLDGFTLEPEDARSLKNCRPGKCAVQLPAETMTELQRSIDWSAPDATTKVNERVRAMALDLLNRYQAEGNRELGVYHDKDLPFDVDANLRILVGRTKALTVYLPVLGRYLLEYPKATIPHVDSYFFWEKVSFGLKPTLRLNHAIAYSAQGLGANGEIVIAKQLYASHYLQLAIDLTACIPAESHTGETGFYLISLKGSTQHGLTGFFGSILRSIIVSRTRSAQEKILNNIKLQLETRQ